MNKIFDHANLLIDGKALLKTIERTIGQAYIWTVLAIVFYFFALVWFICIFACSFLYVIPFIVFLLIGIFTNCAALDIHRATYRYHTGSRDPKWCPWVTELTKKYKTYEGKH